MLTKYQKKIYYSAGKRAGLFLKMRLGKTYLTYALLKKHKAKKILIVAPSSAFISWSEVLRRENVISLYKNKNKKKGISYLLQGEGFYLLNKEGFVRFPILPSIRWDAIVLDESTFIKSPQSKVTKYFLKNFNEVPIKYILTGTPSPESELDYVCQLKFLDDTFPDYWKFRNVFCYNPFLYEYRPTKKGTEILNQYLEKYCFFKTRKAVKYGDIKKRKIINIKYSKEMKERLKKLKDKFKVGEKELKYIIEVFSEMKKTASGYDEDWNLIDKKKLNSLKKLLNKTQGKSIIFVDYKKDTEVLSKELNCKFISGAVKVSEREERIQDFKLNKNKNLIYLTSTGRGGMGLNFSEAKNIIYYSQNPSYEIRMQSEDRACKENKTINIYDLCTPFDKRIYRLRKRKMKKSEFYFKFFEEEV